MVVSTRKSSSNYSRWKSLPFKSESNVRSDSIDRDFERERKEAEQLREREREMHHRYNPTTIHLSLFHLEDLPRARVYPLFPSFLPREPNTHPTCHAASGVE